MRKHSGCIGSGWNSLLRATLVLAIISPAVASTSSTATNGSARWLPGIASGDESVVVTSHRIQTVKGPLDYEARVGRLPIRSEQTGQVRGYIFFVAYSVKPKDGEKRPITFAWNGGPGVASNIIHMEGLGPRRETKAGMVDNPDTPLATTDLVFYDAMETGFSRPASAEFAPEFLNLQGDVAATAEFIRVYRTRFRALDQPLFICGESYGVFRAAALADFLTDRDVKIAGTILVSGDIPNIPQTVAFYDAMHIPARTATAFYHHRLSPELMKNRDATMKESIQWATTVYRPALERVDQLSDAEREKIATQLAAYIGMLPEQIDRKTLVVHVPHYLEDFFGLDKTKTLSPYDTRDIGDKLDRGSPTVLDHYLRDELSYNTDLTYTGNEDGYIPTPGHPARSAGEQFDYNAEGITKEVRAHDQEGEVTYVARANPPWIINAMRREKNMQVLVTTGRYDPLNMCEGDVAVTATLTTDLSSRIENHCYEGGHITYRDDAARPLFLGDLSHFIARTTAAQSSSEAHK
jgi:carboxypeptidase C (cathepsin A)